ncbi:MAG TPA: hypothetical protein ENJ32_11000, partial [Crenotrichaceae bacterium]|nr:hypothetical protein [Crenotrichaceae bacterium]
MLLCVIKRGWIVFFIGLLSACGSGSTESEDKDPVTPKVVTVTGLSPKTVELDIEVDFTVSGKSLDDQVTFEMDGCLSPVLLTNSETRLVFRCTPNVAGIQMATIKNGDGKFLSSYPVTINEKVIDPPERPSMLKTEAKSGINLLSWNAQPDVTYTLYNRLTSETASSWKVVKSSLTETSYEDLIADSHLYEYAVSAVNSAGESSRRLETVVIPQLWIDSLSKKEGDEGVTTPFEFEVTLNRAATQTVTISYKTV